ncbi:hypothetical protein Vi05172_g6897 [Venturia inaequalis]|uniref:Uncharacterized protein n=1 Tax=Venturia inaequalis TaxID=5025 RepID=A0A8H3V801_VENIN|nr:hypothetical protein EG327_005748 [Venturia inaequalis]RDI83156.1 hypothetical protein Vi05172_g6897 [Venturia inaequalis]
MRIMFSGNNPFDALREENEEEVAGSGDSERTLSPKTLKPTIGERVVRCIGEADSIEARGKSSAASTQSAPSPLHRLGNLMSSSVSPVSPTRPTGGSDRPLSVTSLAQILSESKRRKSLSSLPVEDSQSHRESKPGPSIEEVLNRRPSIPSRPVDAGQDSRIPFDESRIYNRGINVKAKLCKVHFSAWRPHLHRGCEDKDCPLHHDPRGWPARVVDMIPPGPIKELLEIQRGIDVVFGKGKFDVDVALVKLKPSIAAPPRGRERRGENKNSRPEMEDLSPEELAAKGRRIQEIWDESLRLYRLRKDDPDAAVRPTRKRRQVVERPQALSFF